MRPHEIFAHMSPERAESFFEVLAEKSPGMFMQAVHAAAGAMKSRPQFLLKQPFPKQAAAVRRAFSRVAAGVVAEEILATYFLECRVEVLTDWLDRVGLEHEDGILKEGVPSQPAADELKKHVEAYRSDPDPDRELLLQAFAAQSTIDWPDLDALLQP